MAKTMTYTDFAGLCGVSREAISLASMRILKPALLPSPKRRGYFVIDLEHPAAVEYYRNHTTDGRSLADAAGIDDLVEPLPDVDISQYGDWSLIRLVGEFGTDERFRNWLLATKLIIEIHAKNLQTLDKEKNIICRDLVRQHIFGSINDTNQRLLIDAPKTIAKRVSAHATDGGTMEDAEKMIRAEISKHLRASQVAAMVGLVTAAERAMAPKPDNAAPV